MRPACIGGLRKGAEEVKIAVGQVFMFGFQKVLFKALSQNCET
jgi:hypothetical protein